MVISRHSISSSIDDGGGYRSSGIRRGAGIRRGDGRHSSMDGSTMLLPHRSIVRRRRSRPPRGGDSTSIPKCPSTSPFRKIGDGFPPSFDESIGNLI